MEWESPTHKPMPNKGRRAGLSFLSSRSEKSLESDSPPSTSPVSDQPVAPPRARKIGGWADEAIKSSKKRSSPSSLLDRDRFGSPERNRKYDDSDEDILLIPEIEDALDDDSTLAPHHGATVAMNRLETCTELVSNLLKNSSFTKIGDIDLSLLARPLHSESEVMEENDSIWAWDSLFTDVSSELHKESDSKEANSERPNSHMS